MLNTPVRCSIICSLGSFAAFGLGLFSTAVLAAPIPDRASPLLPLEAGKMANPHQSAELDEVAQGINVAFDDAQNPKAETNELDLSGIPIVGEMLDENGKFDWGMDIPFSFDFGDLMGRPVVVVGTDFLTN